MRESELCFHCVVHKHFGNVMGVVKLVEGIEGTGAQEQ